MWRTLAAMLALTLMRTCCVQAQEKEEEAPSSAGVAAPEDFTYPSDGVDLKGWLWKRPGAVAAPCVVYNHGSEKEPKPARALAKFWMDHGYAFVMPIRRGHGGNPGAWIENVVALEKGKAAKNRKSLEVQQLGNHDVVAALEWLKKQAFIDATRIVVTGCSYGGIQTIFTAEKETGIRAAVAFAPGAMSWGVSDLLQLRLAEAVRNRKVPLFILQAENDYSLGPSHGLGPELEKSPLAHQAKVYPVFGDGTHPAGHAGFALRGYDVWGADVLAFVDAALKPAAPAEKGGGD